MSDLAFIFGIIGFTMGTSGLVFALVSKSQVDKLEQKLKELKVLEQDYKAQ